MWCNSAKRIRLAVDLVLSVSPEAFAYDADGNQTLVKTATGVWSVTYNGENCVVSYLAYAIGDNDLFYLESAAVFHMPCDKAKSTPGLWSVYPNFERRFYYKDWR